ncbi:hypothetical protein EVAR_36412_1 [Eumeta japonica]|uniref:Uncharacterized protein n=1 Tax=Eumeta variegata TaxID=151549 RepID=A0A4C1VNH9_EUMVA|nr:hypothetical protein EVAR_36412_1 [Eumeta japonica]
MNSGRGTKDGREPELRRRRGTRSSPFVRVRVLRLGPEGIYLKKACPVLRRSTLAREPRVQPHTSNHEIPQNNNNNKNNLAKETIAIKIAVSKKNSLENVLKIHELTTLFRNSCHATFDYTLPQVKRGLQSSRRTATCGCRTLTEARGEWNACGKSETNNAIGDLYITDNIKCYFRKRNLWAEELCTLKSTCCSPKTYRGLRSGIPVEIDRTPEGAIKVYRYRPEKRPQVCTPRFVARVSLNAPQTRFPSVRFPPFVLRPRQRSVTSDARNNLDHFDVCLRRTVSIHANMEKPTDDGGHDGPARREDTP